MPTGTPLDLLLSHVAAAGVDLRENGTDRWRGDCVACSGEDRLTIWQELSGRVGIKCYTATCGPQAVLEALGLPADALQPRREPARGRVTFASEVKAQPVRWLVPGRVPLGAVSLLAGDPKLGKSTLACLFAAAVTLGRFGTAATSLVVSAEDSFANVLKPRAAAAGGDLERFGKFDVVDADGARNPDLPEDVSAIEAAVAEHAAQLVIVDPLNAFLSGSIDSWKDHGIRRALAPLARMAEEQDCAVLVVVHLNKQRGGDPLYRIGGSIGQVGAARSVLSFGRDPQDPEEDRGHRRLLGHLACNWADLAPTQLYEIERVAVELDDELIETSRLLYVGDTDQSAADAFHVRARDERGEDCEDAIADRLGDGKPHPSREVKTAVIGELSVGVRSVERAAKRMKDRDELLVLERATSGQGGARRGTDWQLRGRVTPEVATDPIAERDATSDPTAQSQNQGFNAEVASDGNGDATSDATSDEQWLRSLQEDDDP